VDLLDLAVEVERVGQVLVEEFDQGGAVLAGQIDAGLEGAGPGHG